MPPVVVFISALIQSGSLITALQVIGFSAAAAGVLGYGALALIGYSQAQRAKRKARDAYNASLKDRLVMTSMADAARVRVYGGPVRVPGYVVYKEVAGARSEYYTLVVILAGHAIESIEQIYVGDTPVEITSAGLVKTEPWGTDAPPTSSLFGRRSDRDHKTYTLTATGTTTTVDFHAVASNVSVTYSDSAGKRQLATIIDQTDETVTFATAVGVVYTADYTIKRDYSFMTIRPFLGGDSQDIHALVRDPVYGAFTNSQIVDSDEFRGCAGLVVACAFDTTAFPGGVPAITAVIKGCNTVYDPRTATTGWSDNPALCARDWALYANGGGCIADEIDGASFIAAANACDTSHTYTDSEGVSTTTKLYRLGYVASLDQDPETHLGEMVEAMAGRWLWSGGKLRVKAGVYSSPLAVTIDESWLAGGVSIDRGADMEEMVNIYRPTIADASQDYVPVPLPELRIDSYITADGLELPAELALTAVTFAPQALHICGVLARDARWGRTYRLVCNMKAFPLEGLDVVRLSLARYNAVNKPVEVMGWSFVPPAQVHLVLKETDASIFQPDAAFDVDIPSTNDALPKPWQVPEVEDLAVDSGDDQVLVQADGSVRSRVLVSFDRAVDEAVLAGGAVDVGYSVAGSGVWDVASAGGDADHVYLEGLADGQLYMVRARFRNRLAMGPWSDIVVHRVEGKLSASADVAGLSAVAVSGGVLVTWTQNQDLARSYTRLKLGTVWASATKLVDVVEPENSYLWPWPTAGSYTVLAKHVDSSGNESSAVATLVLSVSASGMALSTQQIAQEAVTEVITEHLASDTMGLFSYLLDKTPIASLYTNETDSDVTVEISLSSSHEVSIPAGATQARVSCYMGTRQRPDDEPGTVWQSALANDLTTQVYDIDGGASGKTVGFSYSKGGTWVLPPGHQLSVYLYMLTQIRGTYVSGGLMTSRAMDLRLTVVKR